MQKVWLIHTLIDGNNRFEEFGDDNIIAISWSNIGDLTGKTKAEIQQKLQLTYQFNSEQQLRYVIGRINVFVYRIKNGDIVIVPRHGGDDIKIGIVKSSYFYNNEKVVEEYCHQRKVEWRLQTTCDKLPSAVQKFLYKCPANGQMKSNFELVRAMANTEHIDSIDVDSMEEEHSTSYSELTPSKRIIDDLADVALLMIMKEIESADSDKKLKIALRLLNLKTKI